VTRPQNSEGKKTSRRRVGDSGPGAAIRGVAKVLNAVESKVIEKKLRDISFKSELTKKEEQPKGERSREVAGWMRWENGTGIMGGKTLGLHN